MLAGRGRLVTAQHDGVLRGFARAHGLDHDASWQRLLGRIAPHPVADAALADPTDALVVHELAVRESARGRGIAGACMRLLLKDRAEAQTLIGVYDVAEEAGAMYERWQFAEIGRLPIAGGTTTLRILAAPTGAAGDRLGRS